MYKEQNMRGQANKRTTRRHVSITHRERIAVLLFLLHFWSYFNGIAQQRNDPKHWNILEGDWEKVPHVISPKASDNPLAKQHTHTHTQAKTHTHTDKHTNEHTHTNTHTETNTQTNTHTHKHAHDLYSQMTSCSRRVFCPLTHTIFFSSSWM